MKKFAFLLSAIVALFATACIADATSDVQVSGEECDVVLSLQAPSVDSRAEATIGKGLTASELKYAIYDADWKLLKEDGATLEGSPLATTLQLRLVKNKTYNFVFWAQTPGKDFYSVSFEDENPTITVNNYTTAANDDSRDAFFGKTSLTVSGTMNETVYLTRPFAQINFGTSDLAEATELGFGVAGAKTTLTASTFTTLNLASGDVLNPVETTFEAAALPGEPLVSEKANASYTWLSMNYILAPAAESALAKCSMTITDANNQTVVVDVPGAPAKRNWRTHLVGNLLTDQANVTVVLDPAFKNEYYVELPFVGVLNADGTTTVCETFEEAWTLVCLARSSEPTTITIRGTVDLGITEGTAYTLPAGKSVVLDITDATLNHFSNGNSGNQIAFDVRGNLTVKGGTITTKHVGNDLQWSAMTEVFYVGFNGSLTLEDTHIENLGGSSMAYAVDLVNAAAPDGVTLNVENSYLKSSYIPVRVFNNGAGMNHVTINNSTLEGTSRAFWVHVYSNADNGGKGVKSATLDIDIYNNNNTFIAENPNRLIEYGFTDEINVTPEGVMAIKDADGNVVEGIGMDLEGNYVVTAAAGLQWIDNNIEANNGFEGKTIKLSADIDLLQLDENGEPICCKPIGNYRKDLAFRGTFDGQGHTIKNLNQNTWALDWGYHYGSGLGLGLFSCVENATIKNLNIDKASISGESALCGIIAATAYGECTFENITVKNSQCNDYQYYAGGIVGWASGNHQYISCNVDESTIIGGQWGDFSNSNGGIIGGAGSSAKIYMKDCNVACRIDGVNDVVSTYHYYAYRCCGMLIGNTNSKQDIDGTPYAAAPNLTCENVTVTYGNWRNYHYCAFGDGKYAYVRVEDGVSVDAYVNIRYGHPTDANGNTVVDHNHAHNDGEDHHLCLPFDQLLGGGPNGDGRNPVYGLASFPGVTVVYPAEYTCPLCGQQHNVAQ